MQSLNREEIKKSILESVESVFDQASEKYDAVGAQASEYYDDAKEMVVDSRRKTVDRIKKNPEQSVLIAAGVGAVVALIASFLFGGRRR
jgi:ElaB/YqjD/DUF883 family membrane-anchored ribosome-binding protein